MDESPHKRFGPEWARRKLDMPRRQRELDAHRRQWLPELDGPPDGYVLDVGAGPGDFVAMCRSLGHEAFGIDAPEGRGGMGDDYLALCRDLRLSLGACVHEIGAVQWVDAALSFPPKEQAGVIHCRGAIEQCFAVALRGDPHDLHHNCRLLDWDPVEGALHLRRFVSAAAVSLRPGGILVVIANGTRSTDEWYSRTMVSAAQNCGFDLVRSDGPLRHKWVKTG